MIGNLRVIIICFTLSFAISAGAQDLSDKAQDFTLETIDGDTVSLSALIAEGKTLLVFFASWCPHCGSEAPDIERFYRENIEEYSVLGISSGEPRRDAAKFAERLGLTYPIALDTNLSVTRAYNVRAIPALLLIDENGVIVYSGHSLGQIEGILTE
jgi:peroxiredoxin